jgi:hypothetical protein
LEGNFSSDELMFSENSVSSVEIVVSSGIITEFLDELISSLGIIVVSEVVSMEMIALTESVADISEVSLDLLFEQPGNMMDVNNVNIIDFLIFLSKIYLLLF